jgi:hypothetical protein
VSPVSRLIRDLWPIWVVLAFCWLIVLSIALSGCGPSQLQLDVAVANAAADAGTAAAPVLEERCVKPMGRALAVGDVVAALEIAARCDAPVAAYDLVRSLHVELCTAIVAVASGRVPNVDVGRLIGLTMDAAQALGAAMGTL